MKEEKMENNTVKKITKNVEKIKENKFLKMLYKVVYAILYILVILILLVVAVQRFSNNKIGIGGIKIYNVLTGSMIPVYNIGDVLIAKTVNAEDIKVGDDIVYEGETNELKGKIITHRVIGIEKNNGEYIFHTKGVANDIADPEITFNQVQGKIVYKFKLLSLISHLTNNLFTMYFIIFVPIVAIIVLSTIRRFKWNNEDDDEEDEYNDENEDDDYNK